MYSHLDKLQEVYNTATKNTEEKSSICAILTERDKKHIL
jgi:hypothetical protein